MNDEEMILKRLKELYNRAYNKGYYTYSTFLGLNGQSVLASFASANMVTLFGGTGGTERVVAAFGDKEMYGYEPVFPIKCIRISPKGPKFAENLSHRDFLGSILSLGIEREQVGDIIIKDGVAHVFVLDNMAAYITGNLDRIRHTPVRCELTEDIPDIYSEAKELVVQIPSERVDVLVSKVYHLSRNDVTSLIKGKKIYIDGVLCNKDGARIKNGNVISVRGYGRIWYGEVMQTTKKGNLCVKVSAAV